MQWIYNRKLLLISTSLHQVAVRTAGLTVRRRREIEGQSPQLGGDHWTLYWAATRLQPPLWISRRGGGGEQPEDIYTREKGLLKWRKVPEPLLSMGSSANSNPPNRPSEGAWQGK